MDSTTCTTDTGMKFSIEDLQKAMNKLPEPPKVFAMDFKVLFNDLLSPNTVVISRDLADEIERNMEIKNAV